MAKQHRATNLQWACIKARTCGESDVVAYSTIHELLCRIEALEAAQQAHSDASHLIDPEKEKMAQEFRQAAGFTPSWSESKGWHYIKDLYGKSVDSPPQPNHPETDSSLKERIKSRLIQSVGSPWEVTTASVLTEIADWFEEQDGAIALGWAMRLEQEAKR